MRIKPFRCLYPDLSLIKDYDTFFSTVKDKFAEYRDTGFYLQEEEESMYVYRIESHEGGFIGLITANALSDYDHAKIKRHEKTLASKEQVLMEFTLQRNAMIKPVLLGFQPNDNWNNFINKKVKEKPWLEFSFTEPKENHIVWKVNKQEELKLLTEIWQHQVDKAYIADGHHRCTTSQIIRDNRQKQRTKPIPDDLLVLYLPFTQLKIFDYNRVIDFSEILSPSRLMADIHKKMKVKPIKKGRRPKNKNNLTFYLEGQWYSAKWKKAVSRKYGQEKRFIDSHLFNEEILKAIMGIKDIRNSPRINNVPGTVGLEEVERIVGPYSNEAIAFMIPPLTMSEIVSIADNEQVLPPKSTWFEPRVKNGLVVLGM